jgi:hypothetical protein
MNARRRRARARRRQNEQRGAVVRACPALYRRLVRELRTGCVRLNGRCACVGLRLVEDATLPHPDGFFVEREATTRAILHPTPDTSSKERS